MQSDSNVRLKVTPRFFLVLAVFLLTIYLAYGYVQGFVRMRQLRVQIEQVQRDIAELEARNAELKERIAFYDSDAYVERAAREELGLVSPGEIPVIVIDGAASNAFEPID